MGKKRKRANGEGYIGELKRGGKVVGYRASIFEGRDSNGKEKRKQFTAKTKKEVTDKLNKYKAEKLLGKLSSDDKITLSEWFYTWLFDYRSADLSPKSFERYEGIYRNYIKDSYIGGIKLKDLRTTHLQRYYNELQYQHNKPASTIRSLNTKLKPCLDAAEKQEYIQKNYCKLVTLPKEDNTKDIKILTKEEQKRFMEYIKAHKLEVFFLTALGTGLRLGELLGLKWSDINFDAGIITVNRSLSRCKNRITGKYEIIEQPPKTKNSYRDVAVPTNILNKLKEHKKIQNKQRLFVGEVYINNNYVFTDEIGRTIDDKRPGRNLKSILKKLNIEPIKFHALRHTYATRLFENNIPPKTVQALLGHSDISVTMDIYTHVMSNTKLEAVEKLNDIFVI